MNIQMGDCKTRVTFLSIAFILLLLPQSFLYSQKSDNSSQDNLEKIRTNLILGDHLSELNPDSAIFYYQYALNFISENEIGTQDKTIVDSSKFYKIVLLNKIGYLFHMQSKYSLAESYYEKGLRESKILNNDSLRAESEFSLAEILLENGRYVDAINSYSTSIELFNRIGFPKGVFWSNIGIGIVYRECGNKKLSRSHYESAKRIGIALKDETLIGICNNNIGNLYKQVGELKSAIEYLELALKSFEDRGEERYISDVLEGIGDVYSEYGDFNKALDYYKRSTKIAETLGDSYRLFSRYANLAKSYMAKKKNEEALMYFSKALKLAQSIGDKARMSEFLILISNFYLENNDNKNAYLNLNKSLIISREIGDTVSIAYAFRTLSELFYVEGNYKSSIDYA